MGLFSTTGETMTTNGRGLGHQRCIRHGPFLHWRTKHTTAFNGHFKGHQYDNHEQGANNTPYPRYFISHYQLIRKAYETLLFVQNGIRGGDLAYLL